MLEYLRSSFRRECEDFQIDPTTRQVYIPKSSLSPRRDFVLPFPVVALGRRVINGCYEYNVQQHTCRVRILCTDGLEYCWRGIAVGSGLPYLENYLTEDYRLEPSI